MTLLLACLIIFISAMVQGATSFGFSLIALPLLGLLYPLKIVVPTLVILSLLLNTIIFIRLKVKPHIKDLMLLGMFAILTIPFGVKLLLVMDEMALKLVVSILLIITALLMLKGIKINIRNKKLSYALTGILSGVLNGAVSLSGPPIVILLANEGKDKNSFRSSLTFLFILLNVYTIILYMFNGLFLDVALYELTLFVPFMIIGSIFGIYLGNKINDVIFKKLVLNLLLIMGIINLF